jgi:hypothetical protein
MKATEGITRGMLLPSLAIVADVALVDELATQLTLSAARLVPPTHRSIWPSTAAKNGLSTMKCPVRGCLFRVGVGGMSSHRTLA